MSNVIKKNSLFIFNYDNKANCTVLHISETKVKKNRNNIFNYRICSRISREILDKILANFVFSTYTRVTLFSSKMLFYSLFVCLSLFSKVEEDLKFWILDHFWDLFFQFDLYPSIYGTCFFFHYKLTISNEIDLSHRTTLFTLDLLVHMQIKLNPT
jgi:hypothetical protein